MPRETQLTILIGVIVTIIGYFVPEYYDWSGADQSRAAPIVGVHAALLAVMTVIALGGIYVWHRRTKIDAGENRTSDPHLQVSIRQIVILTALVACFTAGITGVSAMGEEYQRFGAGLLSASAAFATLLAVLVAILKPLLRLQILGMLACQFGPFLWVGRTIAGSGNVAASFAMGFPVLPALIPAHILSSFISNSRSAQLAIAGTIAIGQIAVGLWLIESGHKRALAYSILLASCSIAGSFIVNALMRM